MSIADQLAKTQRLCDTFNAERRAERMPVPMPPIAQPAQPHGLTDDEREIAIKAFEELLKASSTEGLKRFWWSHMTDLIHKRSPAQIERMERAKGLRGA